MIVATIILRTWLNPNYVDIDQTYLAYKPPKNL